MILWLLSKVLELLIGGLCFALLVWGAWWLIRGSVRKVIREELEQESQKRNEELVELYGFLQGDTIYRRDDDEHTPGLISRIRDVVREELHEHARATKKDMS